jgi:plasmid stabilization system protein ParE
MGGQRVRYEKRAADAAASAGMSPGAGQRRDSFGRYNIIKKHVHGSSDTYCRRPSRGPLRT